MSDGHGEVVIIKRHGGDHDDHHGGAWKIAFADFMCALMAFFLVMWLVSANDKTRASVARYFNPIRLVDATTQPKGLHDVKKDESGITSSPDAKPTEDKAIAKESDKAATGAGALPKETTAGKDQRLDGALHDNPLVALAEIAGTKGPGEVPAVTEAIAKAAVVGRKGGEAFRDPFAPPPMAQPDVEASSGETPHTNQPNAPTAKHDGKVDGEIDGRADGKTDGKGEAETTAVAVRQQNELKTQIMASIKGGPGPAVDVRKTPEGLLVSLTDTTDFAMFTNGSAVPSKRVVLLMDQVAQVLTGKPGAIVVRGYTDNKPYHTARYDNWRLSLDRAQVMHYMLIRGGLPDTRMGHVEGYADHAVKPGVDPASPINRRIEILLKEEG